MSKYSKNLPWKTWLEMIHQLPDLEDYCLQLMIYWHPSYKWFHFHLDCRNGVNSEGLEVPVKLQLDPSFK